MAAYHFPKVIFFDAADTLFHLPKGVGWHYADVASRHGITLGEAELGRAFSVAWRKSEPLPETRLPREEAEKDWWRRLVFNVLDQCHAGSINAAARENLFEELFQEFTKPGVWALYEEVPDVLLQLSKVAQLGILSNFDQRLRPIIDHLGIAHHFTHWILSSEAGAEKPSPWIFQLALQSAGVAAKDALHVGDDSRCDWEGARTAGMQVFELNRPENSLSDLLPAIETLQII